MEEKIVAKKERTRKKKSAKIRAPKIASPDLASRKVLTPPGKLERALMIIARILRSLLVFVEKKIKAIKTAKLAKRMDEKGN